jgi:hypothetical protein
MSGYLTAAALILSAIATVLGIRAATIKVRDSMDHFIVDLRKQGRWTAFAAVAAAAATAIQIIQHYWAN